MKIYVINFKRVLKYLSLLIIIVLLISIVSITGMDVLGVFSPARELPIYCVEASEKIAAITFDCAWGADDIGSILSTLKKENVKATFFLVGEWMKKNPEQVKAIARDGHDVASHGDTHQHMTQLSVDKIKEEINAVNVRIEQLTGQKCILFRPPYGDYNDKVVKTAIEVGQYVVQWDVDSLDWKGLTAENICDRVMRKMQNGSIILLHNDTKYTAAALPMLIKGLKKKGYSPVSVSQLIIRDNYYIDNEGRQHLMIR